MEYSIQTGHIMVEEVGIRFKLWKGWNVVGWMQKAGKPDFSGLRFLIAEDNPLYADLMMELLALRHATVYHASNGMEAVRMLRERIYDAVLMDVRMPGMDGYETTKAIRALDSTQNGQVPVFAMTASTDERDKRSALEAGMNAFLTKPLEMAAFDEALGEALPAYVG